MKQNLTVGFPFVGRALKVPEPYAGKLARTVLRGRKLPGGFMPIKKKHKIMYKKRLPPHKQKSKSPTAHPNLRLCTFAFCHSI
jgi:hypothetical protein